MLPASAATASGVSALGFTRSDAMHRGESEWAHGGYLTAPWMAKRRPALLCGERLPAVVATQSDCGRVAREGGSGGRG